MPTKNKRRLKIVSAKLGKRQSLGLWEATNDSAAVIHIDERLKGFQRLLILVHESLHEIAPDWTEEKVVHVSEILASILWKCDYRHVDHAGDDKPSYKTPKAVKNKSVTKVYERKSKIRKSAANQKMA